MARCVAALAALWLSAAPAFAGTVAVGASNAHRCMDAANGGVSSRAATELCTRALSEEPLSPTDRAGTLVNRGVIAMNRRDVASALADFEAALALRPAQPEALMNRGSVRIAQGRYRDGLTDTDQALKLGVKYPERAYFNRALAREELSDVSGAYQDFRQAAQLRPEWDLPRMELARFSVRSR